MNQVPRSKQFDDVYFSLQDGLAETRHVFIDGNNILEGWRGRDSFTICETGFGTGLNFLAVFKLWQETDPDQRPSNLHFISFEKYPLGRDFIRNSLSHWGELNEQLAEFLPKYPSDLTGNICNVSICEGVNLTLFFGDINDEMLKLKAEIDCWFLDGFKPSSNPDMWSEVVFENMARLSSVKASFATFTAAGFVRRGLVAAGFEVSKVKGFGRKREMCVGRYIGVTKCE